MRPSSTASTIGAGGQGKEPDSGDGNGRDGGAGRGGADSEDGADSADASGEDRAQLDTDGGQLDAPTGADLDAPDGPSPSGDDSTPDDPHGPGGPRRATVGHTGDGGPSVGHVGHDLGHDGQEPGETTSSTALARPVERQARGIETLRGRYNLDGTATGRALRRMEESESDPLNITPELAVLRALLETAVKESEDRRACEECGQLPGLDVRGLGQLADKISRLVERYEKSRNADAVSRGDFVRFCTHIGRVVVAHCDERTAAAISEQILAFRV